MHCLGHILPISDNEAFGRCTECCPKQISPLLTIRSTEEGTIKLFAFDPPLSSREQILPTVYGPQSALFAYTVHLLECLYHRSQQL